MKTNDLADATAHALDLLPPDDAARTDPRLRRDLLLTEETRLTREAAAAVWLAVSPLRVAPPDVLPAVLRETGPLAQVQLSKKPSSAPLMTWVGWAAAAAFAILFWHSRQTPPATITRKNFTLSEATASRQTDTLEPPPVTKPTPRDERLRAEIERLRARLDEANKVSLTSVPRVMSLCSPGAARRSPEEQQERIHRILTAALRSTLEAQSGAPSDPASLVIERGWLLGGLPIPADGTAIRHRNFPVGSWAELGLLRSEDGLDYYDPDKKTLWLQDRPQHGFIGRQATSEDDLTRFNNSPERNLATVTEIPSQPEGFIIEDTKNKTAQVILDQIPPPAPGHTQWITYTNLSGEIQSLSMGDLATSNSSNSSSQFSANSVRALSSGATPGGMSFISGTNLSAFDGTSVFLIPTTNGITSLQVTEQSIVPNGVRPTIILQSGP